MSRQGANIENKTISTIEVDCSTNFICLYEKLYETLVQYATSILGSSVYAADIIQDVFLKFLNTENGKVVVRDPKSFLYRMTRNQCFDKLRSIKLDRNYWQQLSNEKSFASITEQMIEESENQRLMQKAISRLSPQRKRVFVLIKIEGPEFSKINLISFEV